MTATLVVKSGITDQKEYELEEGKTYFIGRSRHADIVVKDQQASRRHCALEATPDGAWTVADQGSSNGTYVNRQRTSTRTLQNGDSIRVGKTHFEVHLQEAAAEPAPESEAEEPDEDTLLVGVDGDMRPRGAAQAPPAEENKPAPAEPVAGQEAAQGADDEDLQDLFAFLDKIEASDSAQAKNDAGRRDEDKPSEQDKEPLVDLGDGAEPQRQKREPDADAEQGEDEGGLLGFLRRKKKGAT